MNIFTLMGTIMVDNAKANESISKTGKESEGLASKLGGGLKVAGGIAAGALVAIGTAAVAMGAKALSASDEAKKALNTLQTQTGSTDQEMQALKETMLSIYGGNYGESFEDVATALASVQQQTGLAGEELEKFTTNALTLRDTFEMDVTESTRSADMMMKQFGITGDEAFNLLAQGAQGGLDKNGNLLDSVNEYSAHFAGLGLDVEDMFNMFSSGAATGVFDIDKLGDAVKEFGIRSKDGSDATADAFVSLGLDASSLTKAFAEGGTEGKKAFEDVMGKLEEMKDPILQNQTGVALFGTMWEDMGATAILALANTNGEINKTKDAMGEINAIKYDSFSEAMAGIGRQIEVGLLVPLGNKLMPAMNGFANWVQEQMPTIETVFTGLVDVLGTIIENVISIGGSVMETLAPAFETISSWFEGSGVTSAGLFNAAFETIGTVINTVAEIIAWFITILDEYIFKNEETMTFITETWNAIKETFTLVFEYLTLLVEKWIEKFQKFWDTWGGTITAMVEATWERIKIIIDTVFKIINSLLKIFISAFSGDWKAVWEECKNLLSIIWEGIKALVLNSLEGIINIFANIAGAMKKAGADMFNSVWDGIKGVWSNISTWITDKVSWLTDKLMFWRKSENEMNTSSSETTKDKGGGGAPFAVGSRYIPYDMPAIVHEGEMIVPKKENPYANSGGKVLGINDINESTPKIVNFSPVFNITSSDPKGVSREIEKDVTAYNRALGLA